MNTDYVEQNFMPKKNPPKHLRRQNMLSIVTTRMKRTVECHCLCFPTLLVHIFFDVNFCIQTIFLYVIESKFMDQKPHLFGWHWLLLPVKRKFFSLYQQNEFFFMNTFHWFRSSLIVFELTMSFYHKIVKGFMRYWSNSYIWKLIGIQIIIIDTIKRI